MGKVDVHDGTERGYPPVSSSVATMISTAGLLYRESLPPECPPTDAIALQKQTVVRFVSAKPAASEDFDSSAKAGRKCPRACSLCQWAACSVFVDPMRPEKITDLAKMPKLRNMRFLAHLSVDTNSGKAYVTKETGHISLWLYNSFDPTTAIHKYTELP